MTSCTEVAGVEPSIIFVCFPRAWETTVCVATFLATFRLTSPWPHVPHFIKCGGDPSQASSIDTY